jgi:threonine/homoserine/homoserine lactone efflux protein
MWEGCILRIFNPIMVTFVAAVLPQFVDRQAGRVMYS